MFISSSACRAAVTAAGSSKVVVMGGRRSTNRTVVGRMMMNQHQRSLCGRTMVLGSSTASSLLSSSTPLPSSSMFQSASSSSSFTMNKRHFHSSTPVAKKMTVEDLASKVNLKGENVLVRVDLNVPLDKQDDMKITDDTRLRAIVPTVQFLLNQNANVILCSHFGRPKGEIIESGKNGRLNPVVEPLKKLLNVSDENFIKVNDCIGPDVEKVANSLTEKQVLLLENTRFYKGETKNDEQLSEGLGKLANYFVMDAFGTSHRAHSSTVGVTKYMKYNVAGYLLDKELQYLIGAVNDEEKVKRPMCAIVGGAKVSTKIPVIESLLDKCDTVLLGGGMIFTFYKALGYNVGASLLEDDMVELATKLMEKAKEKNVKLLLPTDVVVADDFSNDANTAVANVTDISGNWRGLDIGPQTLKEFATEIDNSNTIVWNGPMGVFEFSNFAVGTNSVAQMLADATSTRNAITIVGGGDSVAAINQAGLGTKVSHISTGGGASLELLEGKVLPGVAALTEEE